MYLPLNSFQGSLLKVHSPAEFSNIWRVGNNFSVIILVVISMALPTPLPEQRTNQPQVKTLSGTAGSYIEDA